MKRLDFGSYITVLVGNEEKPFLVHEGVVTNHSKFFYAACNGGFKESNDRTVRLPATSVSTFENFLHWLYTGEVLVMNEEDVDNDESRKGVKRNKRLAELCVAADLLDVRGLRNNIIDAVMALRACTNVFPCGSCLEVIYDQLPPNAKLRQLVVDMYLENKNQELGAWLQKNRQTLPLDSSLNSPEEKRTFTLAKFLRSISRRRATTTSTMVMIQNALEIGDGMRSC